MYCAINTAVYCNYGLVGCVLTQTFCQGTDCGYRHGDIFVSDREHLNVPITNHHCPSLISVSGKKYHVPFIGRVAHYAYIFLQ